MRLRVQLITLPIWGIIAGALAAPPANAATETVIYDFKGGTDGSQPWSGMVNLNGKFYGVTLNGGSFGYGSVFSITPAGDESIVYSFKGGTDGAFPQGNIIKVGKALYGTTFGGGTGAVDNCAFMYTRGCGTVFEVTPDGKETVIYSFQGINTGFNPVAGLCELDGTLYGTTYYGGTSELGTVFAVTPAGSETVLHFFGAADGVYPSAALTLLNGTLYGTTYDGGADLGSVGTVYSITPSGSFHVLHSFDGGADGMYVVTGLLPINGILYGNTAYGGPGKMGVVYSVTPSGQEAVLQSMHPGNGNYADGTLIQSGGKLYGSAVNGGHHNYGTVFEVPLNGKHIKTLYKFAGAPKDGEEPQGALLEYNGAFYGTAPWGGANGAGMIFKITK